MNLTGAEGVMAATHKLVQQAMSGQWQEVPKTVEQRRVLLEQLSANASPQDQQWLGALRQAMAESDAAVAKMAPSNAATTTTPFAATGSPSAPAPAVSPEAQIDLTLEMITKSR